MHCVISEKTQGTALEGGFWEEEEMTMCVYNTASFPRAALGVMECVCKEQSQI